MAHTTTLISLIDSALQLSVYNPTAATEVINGCDVDDVLKIADLKTDHRASGFHYFISANPGPHEIPSETRAELFFAFLDKLDGKVIDRHLRAKTPQNTNQLLWTAQEYDTLLIIPIINRIGSGHFLNLVDDIILGERELGFHLKELFENIDYDDQAPDVQEVMDNFAVRPGRPQPVKRQSGLVEFVSNRFQALARKKQSRRNRLPPGSNP